MRNSAVVFAVAALALAGCTPQHEEHTMAQTVTFADPWASAADTGMTAVFGTLQNTGHHDAHIVSATSPVAEMVELHEVAADANGVKTMRPKEAGFAVPAGGEHELAPGGDHIMLMDLTAPLQPGADVEVTVMFDDGSSLPVQAQVRDFPGGKENYQPAKPHDRG
ncbi:copper chaperone PCu(A)C [Mycolicibacterium smegmatis]|uniref:copper chaperone PCu(A)C n=1 Tax=Mycolicibacterium smegmatis TaxID=1772 RepID=UPI0005D7BFF1|nr:copper chaperone PCu(A)C [Mycolicibacterium smegmatis]MCP2625342.1 copper chaperone PCu(A)C [Mycolicibacterium smegmatis]MCP2626111.1 copper chaperone PCu(A)C [Mycolicibacterium smegmatis]MDF1902519.1 copper chaperone PCu(A)C [Mycolicibacterium smegmatis]MDF1909920.1 copper chaperone PCu(A)C [Mycolicibacterium smegmatis]MDF1919446.1 copper chaperone PCu(A)C [Mycolicibacterium smegmatis]